MKDIFYERAAARLKKGKATKEDVFYVWLHTKTAGDFFAMTDCAVDIAMRYGWLESLPDYWRGDGVTAGGGFDRALAELCFEVVGAMAKGDSDLLSRAEMLHGLETLYNVGGWSRADYIGVAFPLAVRCMKTGAAAFRHFDPSRHGEISRLFCALDKFDFHKKIKVADSVELLADGVECEISRLEECAVSDGVKLFRAAAFLNMVFREVGGVIIDWLKVADIRDNFALSKVRETVTGDESARAKFLSPFAYNERLDYVEVVGGKLWGALLDAARFERSRAGAAHAGEIATAATVAQPQHGAAAGGSCAAAGHVGAADDLLNGNAAQWVTDYKPGVSFHFRCDDVEGVTVNIQAFSIGNIRPARLLLEKDCYKDGWCYVEKWTRPSASKCHTDEERIFFSHIESKTDSGVGAAGDKYYFRIAPKVAKRAHGGARAGAGRKGKTK